MFKDDVHWHAAHHNFSRKLKTKNNISTTTRPARSPDSSVTENVFLAIILKLHIETDESWSTQPAGFGGLCLLTIF